MNIGTLWVKLDEMEKRELFIAFMQHQKTSDLAHTRTFRDPLWAFTDLKTTMEAIKQLHAIAPDIACLKLKRKFQDEYRRYLGKAG